jgi:hypothetical protein
MQSKLTQPPGNHIVVDPPTTAEVLRVPFVCELLASNGTQDGRLKLSAIRARRLSATSRPTTARAS